MVMEMIWSEKQISDFINVVFPELLNDEVLIMLVCARKKYCEILPRSEEILDRKIIRTNDKTRIIQKIKKLASQKFFINEELEIPHHAKAIYVDLNPKSVIKAYSVFTKEVNDQIYNLIRTLLNGNEPDFNFFRKLDIRFFSAIHRSTSRHLYWLIDVDVKDTNLVNKIIEMLHGYVKCVTETRGGYHIIVRVSNESSKIIFTELKGKEHIEVHKQCLTPIPGTLQGSFPVKICSF